MPKSKTVTLSAGEVEYDLIRSSRRTLTLTIKRSGALVIRAPWHMPASAIMNFVISKDKWITEHRGRIIEREALRNNCSYSEGCMIPFLGSEYRLNLSLSGREKVIMDNSVIHLSCRFPDDPVKVRESIEKWYHAEAKRELTSRAMELAGIYGMETGVPSSVGVRKMKTRWGTCRTNGRIMLNSELIKKRQELIDSVILHELCHLRHHNHGKEFYALLEKIMPEYRALKKELRYI